jgi:glycosyltransferase involved in cell wall biosynthesis
MNIGFDAKRAFHNGTGLGHYSRTLINSLALQYPEHHYFLFNPKPSTFYQPHFNNIHIITPQFFLHQQFKSAWRSSWVKKDLKKLNIDLYHGLSHEIPVGIQKTNIKSVVTIHDLIFERYPEQFNKIDVAIYRKKFKYACDHANHVIAISNQTKEDIIQFYGTNENKISICYQSCNPAFAQKLASDEKKRITAKYNLPKQFYLYVGSIIERKNLLTICKALKISFEKNNIPLVVIGKGDSYEEKVKGYVKNNDLEKKIIFLSESSVATKSPDFRTAKDFPAIYQSAVAMIYPSIFEGFGIPVLEALWSRLPVITSNVSCLPEAAGKGSILLEPFNVEQMAEAMIKVANDETLRLEMIDDGWQHAHQFTNEKCAAKVMEVYQQVMKG